jgi:hypothetical protein
MQKDSKQFDIAQSLCTFAEEAFTRHFIHT